MVGVKRHLVDSEFEGAVKEAPDTAFNFAYDLVVSDGSKKVRFSSFFLPIRYILFYALLSLALSLSRSLCLSPLPPLLPSTTTLNQTLSPFFDPLQQQTNNKQYKYNIII